MLSRENNIMISTMLLTPHTIVGIAIATAVPDPLIAVPLSFSMHFLGDLVPHWDYCSHNEEGKVDKLYPMKVMLDMSLGIGIGLFFTFYALWVMKNPSLALNIFLCGIASVLPDALTGPAIFDENSRKLPKLFYKVQHFMHAKAPLPWGLVTQILVSGVCLLLILNSTILSQMPLTL